MIGDLIAGVVGKVLDRVWPDPAQKAQVALELAKLQQEGAFKELDAAVALAQMQTNINKVEGASGDPFASRWRPFIGWVCGLAFGWNWIGLPIARLACEFAGHPVVLSPADMSEMMPVLLGMLGLGAMRTAEKLRDKA